MDGLIKPEFIAWAFTFGGLGGLVSQMAFALMGRPLLRRFTIACALVALVAGAWSFWLSPLGTSIAIGTYLLGLVFLLSLCIGVLKLRH